MGFQYELGEQFAKSLGVKLKIKVAKNIHDLIERLLAGEGDLIAYNLPITKEWKDSLTYCGEEVITHQVIVQRTGSRVKPLKDVELYKVSTTSSPLSFICCKSTASSCSAAAL